MANSIPLNVHPNLILLFLSCLLLSFSRGGLVYSQTCTGCDYVFDNPTGGPSIPNNTDLKVICITAVNRTGNVNLNNTQNATICISENTVLTGTLTNTGSNNVINNFGQYGEIGSARNIALGAGVTYNNFGTHIGNITLNGANSAYNNSGNQTGNVQINSGATNGVYNNSGEQSGNLNLNGGSAINSGQLNLNTGNFNTGTVFTNLPSGTVTVTTNVNINNSFDNQGVFEVNGALNINSSGSMTNTGQVDVTGNFTNNSTVDSQGGEINIGGSFANNSSGTLELGNGSVNVNGNFTNNGAANAQNGAVNVGGNLTNNSSGTLNVGIGTVGGNTTNNGSINIFGELNIDGNLTNNSSGTVSAGNDDQINYLNVGGTLNGAGCYNGIDGILIINQTPPGCTNGDIAIGASSGCLTIIDIPIDEDFFERVYVFTCSTGWVIPDNTADEELVDEAQVLVVAGGGGGGRGTSAGGGGAGGLIFIPSLSLTPGDVVPVIVGLGGAGAPTTNPVIRGANGANSAFLGNIAIGGGGGGSVVNNANRNGAGGGSGGGGARQGSNNGAGGIGSQGNNGATGGSAGGGRLFGAGGGGSSGAGTTNNGNNEAGTGGEGSSFDISSIDIIYSAGGGGTMSGPGGSPAPGLGGSGVGGNGNNGGVGGSGLTPGSGGGAGSTGGGNGANGIVIVRQTFRILPVEYLYFDANFRRQERLVELRWATGKEWENSHFEVQRSVNNVKEWVTVGNVEGFGYSDEKVEYVFQDKEIPLVGGNVFYRLKQVDFDGTFAYSKVVSARVPAMQVTNGVWRAFPNPTDGENFRVSLIDRSQYEEEAITFRLVHPMVFTSPQTVSSEFEMNARLEELVRKMPKGVFVVEIQWGRKVEHIKVIKQ